MYVQSFLYLSLSVYKPRDFFFFSRDNSLRSSFKDDSIQ